MNCDEHRETARALLFDDDIQPSPPNDIMVIGRSIDVNNGSINLHKHNPHPRDLVKVNSHMWLASVFLGLLWLPTINKQCCNAEPVFTISYPSPHDWLRHSKIGRQTRCGFALEFAPVVTNQTGFKFRSPMWSKPIIIVPDHSTSTITIYLTGLLTCEPLPHQRI